LLSLPQKLAAMITPSVAPRIVRVVSGTFYVDDPAKHNLLKQM
jgi:hypothetical protein